MGFVMGLVDFSPKQWSSVVSFHIIYIMGWAPFTTLAKREKKWFRQFSGWENK